MAVTTANALKALIESLGTGLSAYRDQPPEGTPRPYITITEEISQVPDGWEDGKADTLVETAQVDLWSDWHNKVSGDVAEDYTLAPILKRGLNGSRLPQVGSLVGTALVYAVKLTNSIRLLEPEANIVHHSLTVEIHRQI